MTEDYPSVLERELERRLDSINEFKRHQDGLWMCADTLVTASHSVVMRASKNPELDPRATTIVMLWHTLWDYQVDGVFLILSNKLDQAYASLRMASELARDCARIGESEHNFNLWNSRREKHSTEEYKQIFRFKDEAPFEKAAYKLYNLGSNYGVHSHQTTDMYLEVVRHVKEGELVVLKPSETAAYDGLKIWLTTFLPLHMCCIQALPEKIRLTLKDEIQRFWEAFDAIDDLIRQFVTPGLGKLKAEERKGRR